MVMSIAKKAQKYNSVHMQLSKIFNLFGIKKKSIKGISNRIIYRGAYLNKVKFFIKGNNNKITIGDMVKLTNCEIIVEGSNHKLEIKDGCIISNAKLTFTQSFGRISIGAGTTMNGGLIYSGESKSIVIGDDCMFSSNIDIRTTDSHSIISLETNERKNTASDIKIGNHVWLGNAVKVIKGSEIGDGSIVGAGSIVTKKIEKNCTAVGVPAKTIQENVTWDRKLV